nr:hypothetical protein [Tanacetum cinerariifolium]
MMIYLKNMAGFKTNFFKGMTYSEIRPLFEKHYNSNQAFLVRVEEEVTVQKKEIEEEGNKRQDMDEDVEVNLEETQAKAYNLDLQHSKKVLSMQDIDEEEPAEVEEVLEVVTAAKLMTKVGIGFSRVITSSFKNRLVSATEEVGQAQDDVSIPTEPSTSKPHKKHKSKKQQPIAPKVSSPEPSPEHTIPSPSNDPIPDADKDSLKFQELMNLCTTLSNKVLHLQSEFTDIKSSFTKKIKKLEDNGRMIADMDEDVEVNLEETQAKAYNLDLQHSKKVLSMQDIDEEEPAEVEEVLEVVTAAKLMTKNIYDNPSLTKKVFSNMKKVGIGFSRVITSSFKNRLVSATEEVGQAQDDVSIPTEPSTSKPHKKHK